MNLDPSLVGAWLGVVLGLIALGTQAKTILSAGEKMLDKRLEKAEGKLVEYDRRIQTVEGEMKHMPDRETAHRLELAVEKMSGRLDTMAETLKPIRATTERMNELLVEQAKK